jgi:hypothetical protein
MRIWARAARGIIDLQRQPPGARRRYHLVRYEDLHQHTEREVRAIFEFLDLDPAPYDFDAAARLPVVGSSSFKRGTGGVRWLPVAKTPDFDPLARAAGWGQALHERFDWLAGDSSRALGYGGPVFEGRRFWWGAWNRALDARWRMRKSVRRLRARMAVSSRDLSTSFRGGGQ